MSWTAVLLACAVCYLIKLAGYLAPRHWLEHPEVMRLAGLVTVGLLASLVAVQTFATGRGLELDARAPALLAAAVALWLRAPFIVVVVVGAATAAVVRALG